MTTMVAMTTMMATMSNYACPRREYKILMTTMVAMTTMSNYACPCRVQKPDDNDDGDDNNDDNDNSGDDDNDDDDDVQLCMPK